MQRTKPTQPLAVTAPNQTATLSETKFQNQLTETLSMAECLSKHAADLKSRSEALTRESNRVVSTIRNLQACYTQNPEIKEALDQFKWNSLDAVCNIRRLILTSTKELVDNIIHDEQLESIT